MVEVPITAINLKSFFKVVDFFSIGTNDLIQYTMACDRTSKELKHLYQNFNPGILKIIASMISLADQNQKKISVCGELASLSLGVVLLIGMGLTLISVNIEKLPKIRKLINQINYLEAKKLVDQVLTMDIQSEVEKKIKE
jgi:phosphotransferase system enzyme I (PtsI)